MELHQAEKPKHIFAETDKGWIQLAANGGNCWRNAGIEVITKSDNEAVSVALRAANQPVKAVRLIWDTPIAEKSMLLGDHWERGYGDLEWRGIVPERVMPWYFLSHHRELTEGYGVQTGAGAMCYWQADTEHLSLTADVRCGEAGVLLGDRTLEMCRIVVLEGKPDESPFSAARRFCRIMCKHPVLPSQPVYGGNNWYYAYGKSSHEDILRDSAFIASLSPSGDNRPYMIIDDGWQLCSTGGSCNGGPWTGNYLFPDMPGLAAEMKEIGVKPGIWCRPLLVHHQVPDNWKRFTGPNGIVLDPSTPEVLNYVSETIRSLSDWGYELIKHDFTTFDLLGTWGFQMGQKITNSSHAFADRSKTTAEIILQLYRTIADASGSSIIIGCNTIGHLAAGLFEIQRTGDDTSGKSWERTRRMGINTLAFRMPQHETFFSHDADCAGVTDNVPWELNKQWIELLAESGTPLFLSVKPGTLTPEQQAAVRHAFELASQTLPPAEPLDWLNTTCPRHWKLRDRQRTFKWNLPISSHNNDNEWWL